jgi:glucosylceramidase
MKFTATVFLLAVLCGAAAAATSVTLIQTAETIPSKDHPDRLAKYVYNISDTKKADRMTLKVDLDTKYQTLKGFGGAFTDSVAHVFSQLNSKLQEEVLEAMWGETGQKYNLARLTVGGTDFSVDVYNYNEKPNDFDQENFTIKHDTELIIPLIHQAQKKAAETSDKLEFLSSSWSPPGWMKRAWLANKGYMRNSAKPGMLDDPKMYKSYALYFSKYLTEYKKQGINISMMTIQNEPDSADHMFPVAYPACNFNGTGEGEYLLNYLGPQIRKDHPDVKIFVHDGQKFHDVPILTRVDAIIEAAGGDYKYIDGVAFHWYGDNLNNYQYLKALNEKHPNLSLMATEATLEAPGRQTIGTSPWKEAQKYAVDIIGDLNENTEGWIEWNVLLDSKGGPTCIGPTNNEFCTPLVGHCDAPILADTKKQTLEYRDTFWIMAHFSRFIPRGSVRVSMTNDTETGLKFTSFVTPDNVLVMVIVNTQDNHLEHYQINVNDKYVHIPIIHSHSIQTVLYDLKTTKEEKDEKKKKHEEEGEEKLLSHRSSEQ